MILICYSVDFQKEGVEFNNVDDAVNIYLRSQISPGQTQPMIKVCTMKNMWYFSGNYTEINYKNIIKYML